MIKLLKPLAPWITLVTTFVVFVPALSAGFVEWDDPAYIVNNPYIKELTWDSIIQIFKVREFEGNYHPLSLLSHAIDHSINGLDPFYFHLHSLLLHLVNVALVFWFINLLTKRWEIAFITTLLFGIHPMHVESVAWATERKDVLYVFYLLLGLVAYMYYREREKIAYYFLAMLFLILSALSKGQAVIFPILLVLIDYFRNDLNWKTLWAKTPFFIISLAFGLLAISIQDEGGASSSFQDMGGRHKLFIAGYGTLMYLVKALVPFKLSAFHPYPPITDGWWPWYIYAASFVLIIILAFAIIRYRSERWLILGLGTFLVCIIPVSQIIPVGKTIMAERYTYLAYLGLFFALAYFLIEKVKLFERKALPIIGFSAYLIFLSVYAYSRSTVWQDSVKLWTDVTEKYPNHHIAYANRAAHFYKEGLLSAAVRDYEYCAQRSPDNPACPNSKGLTLRSLNKFPQALENFNRSLEIDSLYYPALLNRGMLLSFLGNDSAALKDMNKLVEINPDTAISFLFRAVVFEKLSQFDDAIKDYSILIIRQPYNAGLYTNRGLVLFKKGETDAAIEDYSKAIRLNPNYPDPYYRRSKLYWSIQEKNKAIEDIKKAIELGYKVPQGYLNEINQSLQDE